MQARRWDKSPQSHLRALCLHCARARGPSAVCRRRWGWAAGDRAAVLVDNRARARAPQRTPSQVFEHPNDYVRLALQDSSLHMDWPFPRSHHGVGRQAMAPERRQRRRRRQQQQQQQAGHAHEQRICPFLLLCAAVAAAVAVTVAEGGVVVAHCCFAARLTHRDWQALREGSTIRGA
jgi:hypothetical protein